MKRRAIDFTSSRTIVVLQSEATGRFWSEIRAWPDDGLVWEMTEPTDSRSEAFGLACNRLDALAEQYVSEGEPE